MPDLFSIQSGDEIFYGKYTFMFCYIEFQKMIIYGPFFFYSLALFLCSTHRTEEINVSLWYPKNINKRMKIILSLGLNCLLHLRHICWISTKVWKRRITAINSLSIEKTEKFVSLISPKSHNLTF